MRSDLEGRGAVRSEEAKRSGKSGGGEERGGTTVKTRGKLKKMIKCFNLRRKKRPNAADKGKKQRRRGKKKGGGLTAPGALRSCDLRQRPPVATPKGETRAEKAGKQQFRLRKYGETWESQKRTEEMVEKRKKKSREMHFYRCNAPADDGSGDTVYHHYCERGWNTESKRGKEATRQ